MRGCDPSTIRRQLHALNARSGGRVISKRKGKTSPIKTTAAALGRADRTLVDDETTPEERVARLERNSREQRQVNLALKKALAEALGRLAALESLVQLRAVSGAADSNR